MEKIFLKKISLNTNFKKQLTEIGFDETYIDIAKDKYKNECLKIFNLRPFEATILKQICLSLGTDCAVSRGVLTNDVETTDALILTSLKNFSKIVQKLENQPFRCKEIAQQIKNSFENFPSVWEIKKKKFDWQNEKYVMGILNLTEDSFSDGGKYLDINNAIKHVEKMVEDGVDILDIGAESTRPGAFEVDPEVEIKRIEPVLKHVCKNFPNLPISIDTRHMLTAKACFQLGADIINDVSALDFDDKMFEFAKKSKMVFILNHSSSTPCNMQKKTCYKNVIDDIFKYLYKKVEMFQNSGLSKVIVDPGIGFGKETFDNIEIIKSLEEFKSLKKPVLIGLSRKSFLRKYLDIEKIDELDFATSIFDAISFLNGANIVRLHRSKNAKILKNIFKLV